MRRYFLILSLLAGVTAFGSANAFADERGSGYDGYDHRGARESHARDSRDGWGQDRFGRGDTYGRAHGRRDERGFRDQRWHHRRGDDLRWQDRDGRNDWRDGRRD